jgi:hypothetical protein
MPCPHIGPNPIISDIIAYTIKSFYLNSSDMGRRRKEDLDKREKISVTLPRELIRWLDEMVDKRAFANRSHGVEVCLMEHRDRREKG